VADPRHPRGLIDTSVVIDLELIEPADLPVEIAVSAITMAELAADIRPVRINRPSAFPTSTSPTWVSRSTDCLGAMCVRTAVSTPPSARQAAKREAGARWICSVRPPQWRQVCPCTRATRPISLACQRSLKSSRSDRAGDEARACWLARVASRCHSCRNSSAGSTVAEAGLLKVAGNMQSLIGDAAIRVR